MIQYCLVYLCTWKVEILKKICMFLQVTCNAQVLLYYISVILIL